MGQTNDRGDILWYFFSLKFGWHEFHGVGNVNIGLFKVKFADGGRGERERGERRVEKVKGESFYDAAVGG